MWNLNEELEKEHGFGLSDKYVFGSRNVETNGTNSAQQTTKKPPKLTVCFKISRIYSSTGCGG